MSYRAILKTMAVSLALVASASTFAWNHGISIGAGGGSDINHHTDTNWGEFLAAEFLPITQTNRFNFTFGGSLGDWHSDWVTNKNLYTAALSLSVRPYVFESQYVHPFFLASGGPAYLSKNHLGRNNQASNFAFQSILGLGVELGTAKRVDLNMRMVHYSNGFILRPNDGFNIFYVFSVGYLF